MTTQARLVHEASGRLHDAAKHYTATRANFHQLAQGYPGGGQSLGGDLSSRTETCALNPDAATLASRTLDRALRDAHSHARAILVSQVPRLAKRTPERITAPNPATVVKLCAIILDVDVWNRDTASPVRRLLGDATEVYDVCRRWSFATRPATAVRSVRPTENDPWCKSCARIPGTCEPIGRTDASQGLCAWCYGFVRTYKQGLPPLAVLQAYHRGERITSALVVRHMRSA